MSIKDKYYRNVGIAFASFVNGDPGDYSTDDAGNEYWTPDGSTWKKTGSGGGAHVISASPPPSDQGDDLSLSTTALSGGAGAQAIPTGTTHIRFTLQAVSGANNWARVKFGDVSVVVTSSTGSLIMASAPNEYTVPVPSGATHFDAIAGASLTMNWTPT